MTECEMDLFEAECKLLCYKGNMSRSNLGSFYNNEQTNWMYQMWLSSKNRHGYKLFPVEPTKEILKELSGNEDNAHMIYKAVIGAIE